MSLNSVWNVSNVSNVLNVVAFNDSPTITVTDGETTDGTPVTSTVDENTAGALLGAITVSDANQTLTAAHITTSDDRFVVVTDDQGNLWLALADGVSLDYESGESVDVTVTVTDDEGATAQATVTITVHDIDEAPDAPSITPAASNFMVEEDTPYGMNLALLNSRDPEGGDVTFHVDNQNFEIEVIGTVAILKLKNAVAPDREATENGTITLAVTASDAAGNVSDATEVVVTIVDVNEAPTGEDSVGSVTAGADTPATGNVNASDVDEGDTLSFSVEDAATYGALTVDAAGVWIYTLDETDAAVIALAEGVTLEDTAAIVIADDSGATATVDVTITITGANENPTGEDGSGAVTVGGEPVSGNVNAADVDEGDGHLFSVGTAASYGQLSVNRAGTWTYSLDETNEAVTALAQGATLEDTATIVITDTSGGTASVEVTITITGVNNVPTGEDSTGAVTAGGGPVSGNVKASDADDGDTLSFAVDTAATYGILSVDATGAWTYTIDNTNQAVIALTSGATLEDTATIVITDSQGVSTSVEVTITITGVNDAPTGEDASGAVLKGGDPDTGTLTASDVDTGDTLSFSVDTAPDYGALEIDDASGNWTYTLNEEHADVTALADDATLADEATISITDSSAGATSVTLSITVYATNDAPTVTVADGQTSEGASAVSTINENAPGLALGIITVSDANQDLDASHVSTSDERFVIKTDGPDGLYLALADGVSLDHEAEQSVNVTVRVTDDLNATAEHSVTITVNDQNDPPGAPTVTPGSSNFMVTEGDTNGMNLADLKSTDPEGDAITFHVDHQDFEIEVVGSASLLKVKDGVALDREATEDGTITINVTASDANGAVSDPTPVAITIVDVNEGPSISVAEDSFAIDENTSGRLRAVTVSDPEQTFGAHEVTLSDTRFSVEADESGVLWLVLNEGLDAETEAAVSVQLAVTDDGGLTGRTLVTISVTEVNEPPTLSVTDATRLDGVRARSLVSENETVPVGLISIADPEDDLVASNITLSDPRFGTETDEQGNIWLLINQAADYETDGGNISVTVTVTDTEGLSAEVDVELVIVDVNEAPTISVADGETLDGVMVRSTIEENATGFVGAITVSDPEQPLGADDITLNDARFSVEADLLGGLWLVLDEEVDADTEPTISVELEVVDSGGLTTSTEVTITIVSVNEIPTVTVSDATRGDGTRARSVINENETGAIGLITLADPEEDLDATNITLSDPRFVTETDSEGRIWLLLDEAADYETDGSSLTVTLTVTDTEGLSSEADVRVRIVNVNDAPHANQEGVRVITQDATDEAPKEVEVMGNLFATAGEGVVQMKLDLGEMFSDQDGDSLFRYHLEDAPSWLTLINVVYADDGSVTGILMGTVPVGNVGVHTDVKIVATDEGGAEGYATFDLIVDDGNDTPTAIHLTNTDDTDNAFFDLEVDEHAQGTMLGYLTVDDQDDPRHPHGQHTWKVDEANEANFEIVQSNGRQLLKLKDNAAIDFEEDASISLIVTVTDGGEATKSQTIQVEVNDMNDPVVVANQPGNWWVTINEDAVDPETVAEGGYLTFALEVEGTDTLPLFTDQDAADASIPDPADPTMNLMIGKLTYAIITGPDWLEIDPDTGVITNKAGVEDDELPERGVYDVTVSATDGAGSRQTASFKLAVAVSGADDADNEDPNIGSRRELSVAENSAEGTIVATFTVTDDDLDLTHGDTALHPWADVTVVIEDIEGIPTDGGNAVDLDDEVLELVVVSRSIDSITYNVRVTEEGAMQLDYETYDEITFNVRAYDGVADETALTDQNSDLTGFDFEITDVNEAPTVSRDSGAHSSANLGDTNMPTVAVEQSEADTITLYINLSKYFQDLDEDDDDDELVYSVTENTPWITITNDVGEWRDVQEGPDGDDGTDDDVTWGPSVAPDDRDYVVVLEIDRTGMTNSQDDDGSFTITVRDAAGQSIQQTVMVAVTDENLSPAADAVGVTLNDNTPLQNDRLTMRFDDGVDPDFTGAEAGQPILEVFEWYRDNDDATDGDGDLQSVSVDNPDHYSVTQADVGMVVQASAVYFELFDGMIVKTEAGATDATSALEARSEAVADRPDAPTGGITFTMTNDQNQLVAVSMVDDPDGIVDDNNDNEPDITYTWEYSVNGRGGWVADTTDTDNDLVTTVPEVHQGKFVRLVATFTDEGGSSERVVSTQELKVGAIMTAAAPAITGYGGEGATAVAVGRTLEVDITDAENNDLVEWMAGGMVVGSGTELTVTTAHAGMAITARITTKDANGNVTSISTSDAVTVAGAPPANTQAIAVANVPVVLLGKAPAMDGELQEYRTTIDANTLFEDVEGGLTFSFAGQDVGTDDYENQPLDVYLNAAGNQLLVIDETTGEVRFYTTAATGHGDGGTTDAGGNTLDIQVTATEMVGGVEVTTTNTVSLAIDVPGTYTGGDLTATVAEHTEMTDATTTETAIQTVNITDLNSPSNEYGRYDWAISDERFSVMPDAMDSSMAAVAIKADQTFEIDPDNGEDGTLMVTITATPKSGGEAITIMLTVTITNQTDDDPPASGDPNEVPGLKDNESDSNTNADDEEEDGDDADDDAGTPAPMDAYFSVLDDGM